MPTPAPWTEVADGVLVRRYPFFDQEIGFVIGRRAVLVVDSRSSEAQGRETLADLRSVCLLPHVVVNTHFHFDHTFGNAAFRPCEIWGHASCASALRDHGEEQRAWAIEEAATIAADVRASAVDPPDRLVVNQATIDLGGRQVAFRHLGLGHTDNDLVVIDKASGVVFAGDLVEQGAPPTFEDSYPLDWPGTLGHLLDLADGPVVPGHGDVVDRDFVANQLSELAFLAEAARRSWPDLQAAGHDPAGRPPADLVVATARHLGWPEKPVRTALRRGIRQAAGRL